MTSLDNLLHEAECLERGSKSGSVSAISFNQLSKFFNQVSPEQKMTLEGRILLAQQGIDSAKNEAILKDMESEQKPEESLSYIEKPKIRHHKMTPYNAIQNFELIKQDYNKIQRKRFRDEMLSFCNNKEISEHPTDPDSILFPTDPRQLGRLSEYAETFAIYQINKQPEPFKSTKIIIEQSIKAIDSSDIVDESTSGIRIDFFLALKSIICNQFLPEDFSSIENSNEYLHYMAAGSIDFLMNQYKFLHFPDFDEITSNNVEDFVMRHFPDVQPPWPQIWVCIRAGLFHLVHIFCEDYPQQTEEFWHYFDSYILQKEEPSAEIRSNIFINTKPLNMFEALRTFCYIFTIGENAQQLPVSYLKTAEDFIFLLISPHRFRTFNFDNGDDGEYNSELNFLQQLVAFEGSKLFNTGNDRFVYSMLLLSALKFDLCAKSLIENKIFPVEVIHILIILNQAGLLKKDLAEAVLPNLINEFIGLLPLTMTPQIVDYLSLANNRKILVKFLLSLDLNEYSVNLNSRTKENALRMIQEEISSNLYSITSLHLFTVTLEYDNACDLITAISNDIPESFTLKDILETVLICSIILNKLNIISNDTVKIINLQNAALQISTFILSVSDQLTQNEREILLSNVKKLRSECTFYENDDQPTLIDDRQAIERVSMLSNLLHLLVLFDSGRSDLAALEAVQVQQIIPFTEPDLEHSLNWIDQNRLPSTSLIGTVITRFLSYYIDNNQRNEESISTLFKFCSRFQNFSDDTNRKLLLLQNRYKDLIAII